MQPWDHPLSSRLLSPLSFLYGGTVRLRQLLYRKGVFKQKELPTKVLSVGNLTVGGSGKTPLVATIAKALKGRGWRVAILSRGYLGAKEREGAVVSDGREVLIGAEAAGDEPYMLAKDLAGVIVAVGRDRYRMGMELSRNFKPQVVILDDGFQHLGLHRDLDLVAVAADDDLFRWRLLPAGPLREPLSALKRANAVVITHWRPSIKALEHEERLREVIPRTPFFHAEAVYPGLVDLQKGDLHPPEVLRGLKVSALCAIAKPQRFFQALEELGLELASTTVRPDHHRWRHEEIREASSKGEVLVTTEKDAVRFPFPPERCYVLKMKLVIKEREFWAMLGERLSGGKDDLCAVAGRNGEDPLCG